MLIVPMTLVFLTSCSESKPPRTSSFYESSVNEEVEEDIPDAEQKSQMFYQHLLEKFCQQYYDGCFNGRDYHPNSVVIDGLSVISPNRKDNHVDSWNMKGVGRHSFEGFMKNHNDSPFEAYVYERGNDAYEITFYIRRYGLFGEQLEDKESATRTMTYSE